MKSTGQSYIKPRIIHHNQKANWLLHCISDAKSQIILLGGHKQKLQVIIKYSCCFLSEFGAIHVRPVHICSWDVESRRLRSTRVRILVPRKYTWPFGGYFLLFRWSKCIFSKLVTAQSGLCIFATSKGTPSWLSSLHATSSNASNLVKITITGTAYKSIRLWINVDEKEYVESTYYCHIRKKG